MKIQMLPLNKVKPYKNNPRNNEAAVAKVARSIKEFGFQQPIVTDKTLTIVAGHTRWLAARSLCLSAIPVHVAENLSPEQAAAYRLADNKVAEIAEWDDGALMKELQLLADFKIDMSLFGFTAEDMGSLQEMAKKDDRWLEDYTVTYKPKPSWILMTIPEDEGPALLKELRARYPESKVQGSFEKYHYIDSE